MIPLLFFSAEFKDLMPQQLNLDLVQNKAPLAANSSKPEAVSNKNLAWFDLFAELDPIKNPDTLGKENVEDERNC